MNESKKCCVYAHIVPNGKAYIGITSLKAENRWRKDGKGYEKCPLFWKAICKYGWGNIKHIVLIEDVTKEVAGMCEQVLIAKYKTNETQYGYNNTPGGDKGNLGYRFTEEQKAKVSKAKKGRIVSEETRRKIGTANSIALKGKKQPKETVEKRRISMMGKNVGKHPSEKARKKNSLAHIGKQYHLGFKHSEEARMKMHLAKLGKPLSEAQKKHLDKLHESAKGRKHNYIHGRAKAVMLNGIYYPTIASAAQSIGVSDDTLIYHMSGKAKIKKYDCKYVVGEGV